MSNSDPEPLAVRPQLRAFVEAAREQQTIEPSLTAEQLHATWEQRGRARQAKRTIVASGVVALAAAAVAVLVLTPALSRDRAPAVVATAQQLSGDGDHPSQSLDAAVRARSTGLVEVRGPWSIALGEGRHEIEVEAVDGHALLVALPERELELAHGRAVIEVSGDVTAVRLETGVAAWVDLDGSRTAISVTHVDAPAPTLDAETLARQADAAIVAGDHEQAIAWLEQLVRSHPEAPQARAATLDLGRLLRATGQRERARCAYQLFRDRWPGSELAREVGAQLRSLGGPRGCLGLTPQ